MISVFVICAIAVLPMLFFYVVGDIVNSIMAGLGWFTNEH